MDLDKLVQEKYISVARKGYVSVNGYTLSERYEQLQEDLDSFEINENDVWLCSFPKSGTTWLQEMVWLITNNLDFENAKIHLEERSPFLEFSMVNDFRELNKEFPDLSMSRSRLDSIGFTKSLKHPVVIKTHLPWELLPREIRQETKKPKIIYIARDVKDVCVSYYHHSRLLEGYKGNFEEFCELFLGDRTLYSPYWKHFFSFWNVRNKKHVLFLKYEELKKDLGGVIKIVANFLDYPLSVDQVDVLTKHLSFESMRANPAVNKEHIIEFYKRFNFTDYNEHFIRSGKTGSYEKIMTPEILNKFNRWIKINTAETDYKN